MVENWNGKFDEIFFRMKSFFSRLVDDYIVLSQQYCPGFAAAAVSGQMYCLQSEIGRQEINGMNDERI